MKVLFANPPWFQGMENGQWRLGCRAGSRWPFSFLGRSSPDLPVIGDYSPFPQFLAYAATYCAKAGAEVVFRDSIALRESYASFMRFVREGHFDYLVLETATPCWVHDSALLLQVHKWCPGTKIIVTGPIATTKAEEILNQFPVHAVVKGELEKGVVRVLHGESGLVEFDLLTVAEMNAAPIPYMDATVAPLYFDSNPRGQIHPHAQVWSGRGCLWKCLFCSFPANMTNNDPDGTAKRSMRFYTADYMEAFLTEWRDRFGFKSVYFDDDLMNGNDKHTLAMCRVMEKVRLPWSAMCRVDTLKPDTWRAMRAAGCFGLKLGYEVGSQRIIDDVIHKNLNLEKARETTKFLKGLGFTIHGTFMMGLPGETKEEVQMTRDYIASLPLDTYQLSGAAEIEGSPMHTLRVKGHLDKYPGAKLDDNYVVESDGQKKAERMSLEMSK